MSVSGGLPFDKTSSTIKSCYLCSLCQYLLVEPKCTTCGHRYCSTCLEKLINEQFPVCSIKNCTQVITNNIIYTDSAMKNDMKRLSDIVCHNKSKGCSWRGDYTSYANHLQVCTLEGLQCEQCSLTFIDRFLYEQHGQLCPKALISCPLKKFGCDIQVLPESIHHHIESSLVQHIVLLADSFSSFINQSMISCKQSLSTSYVPTAKDEHLDNRSLQNKSVNENPIKINIDSQQSLPSCTKPTIKYEQDIINSDIRLKLNEDKVCKFEKQNAVERFLSNDNGLFWRINNIQDLFQNARKASEPTYVSSSFDIENSSYQISLKLYLNGDNIGRNTYLSLYVRIIRDPSYSYMNGSYRYAQILLCLYDNSPDHNHVIHKITLEINNEYFQQQTIDENEWSKVSKFCPLSMVLTHLTAMKSYLPCLKFIVSVSRNTSAILRTHNDQRDALKSLGEQFS
ncbi:unnamed protein product [Rotaria sp. Silwood1]|nr:unnamed protein product [Rotaria sp. Silwood1]CAF0960021.1 unnamed protein product [Rotaria sp. Silwood1]